MVSYIGSPKGENQLGEFKKIAEELESKIFEFEGIECIIVQGGLVH